LVPLILDHKLRKTRQIANAFQPLVDHPMRFLGGEGPAVSFVACSRDEALSVGDDQIEALIEQGWRPEDVALLTTGGRHPEQTERQKDGHKAYWDTFWDTDQVFYGHALGFKGLERRAVVLVVNEVSQFDRSRERLYVGLSRAPPALPVRIAPVAANGAEHVAAHDLRAMPSIMSATTCRLTGWPLAGPRCQA
jgi:hypothetical protein